MPNNIYSVVNISLANIQGADSFSWHSAADILSADVSAVDISLADILIRNISAVEVSMVDISVADISGVNTSVANISEADFPVEELWDKNVSSVNPSSVPIVAIGYLWVLWTANFVMEFFLHASCPHKNLTNDKVIVECQIFRV